MPSRTRRAKGPTAVSTTVAKSVKRKVADSDEEYTAVSQSKRAKKAPSKRSGNTKEPSAEMAEKKETSIAAEEVKETSTNVTDMQRARLFKPMTDLPTELIYEIANHLRPADLASLCDTSVWMWRTLCNANPTTVSLWRKSREREEVYYIPHGMNEYHWAKLFFGSRCMECGTDKVRNAAAVDFHIRRRLCNPCKQLKYMAHGYPNDRDFGEGLALCPATQLKWDGTNNCLNKFSWSDDVIEQQQKINALNLDVRRRKASAKHKLADYVTFRNAALRHMQADVGHLTKLNKDYLNKLKEENSDKFRPRYEQVERKFIELGYRVNDLPPSMKMHKLVRQKTTLTERAWQSIREVLEPEVQTRKSEREAEEWTRLKVSRRQMVDKLYAQFKFNYIPAPEWRFMPQVHHICRKPEFAALIESDRNRTVTVADFSPYMEGLGESLVSAFEQTRIRLHKRVLAAKDPFFTCGMTKTQRFKDLELAAIVFRCTTCNRGVFGWDDVRSHCCDELDEKLGLRVQRDDDDEPDKLTDHDDMAIRNVEFPHTYKYWEQGSIAVRLVLESLGLDPKTTTTAELDENPELRLECWCSGQGSRRRCAHKWRMLAWHLTRGYHEKDMSDSQKKPLKGKVPDACIFGIIHQEFEDFVSWKYGFICAHCTVHLRAGKQTTHRSVESHLSTEHAISGPRVNIDYVMMANAATEYHYFYDGTYFDYTG